MTTIIATNNLKFWIQRGGGGVVVKPLDGYRGLALLMPKCRRCLLSSSSSTETSTSSTSTVWERGAVAVKNTDATNPYLESIRAKHVDPAQHIKTIEDELKGTIGKALGKQGEKILYLCKQMKQQYELYYLEENNGNERRIEIAKKYNEIRKMALKARWELTVHRQAAGFIVNNYNYVNTHYPISPALPEENDDNNDDEQRTTPPKKKKKQFTDQLDWWQRFGRWK